MRGLVAILMLSLCGVGLGAPSEHNYKAKQDDWEYTYRHREGAWHVEIGNKVETLK